MRKVFLEGLPRKKSIKSDIIDWRKSIGMTVKFIFDDIEGEFNITGVNDKNNKIILSYNGLFYEKEGRELRNARIDAMIGKKVIEFRYKVGENIKTDFLDMTVIERYHKDKGSKGKVKCYRVKCNTCGWDDYHIEESVIKYRKQCACCSGNSVVEGINDITTTEPWMVKYFQGGYDEAKLYTKGSSVEINPICPDCGKTKDKSMRISRIYENRSIGCSCSDKNSYPQKFVNEFLMQLNVEFASERRFEWSNNKRYDFYIPSKKIVIEVHGQQHYKDKFKDAPLEHQKENDAFKRNVAEENGLKYIEIDASYSTTNHIKKSLINSKLNDIFNLEDIDWNKCAKKAASNLIKEASELKRKNPKLKTTDIAKIINRHPDTISEYLTRGSELGWCEYNPKYELKRVHIENSISKSKSIKVYKNGDFIYEFKSLKDMTINSKDIIGEKLYGSRAASSFRKNKSYKGYTFKCVD